MHVEHERESLESLTMVELRQQYAEVFGETTGSRHKGYIIRRILWKRQADKFGGLSRQALQRARELAADSQVRLLPPAGDAFDTPRLKPATTRKDGLRPGTLLSREYKGRIIRVAVLDDGFEYEGRQYRSLTAVVKALTGSHWNGRTFFGLHRREE